MRLLFACKKRIHNNLYYKSLYLLASLFLLFFFIPNILFSEFSSNSSSEQPDSDFTSTGLKIAYRLDSAPMQFRNKDGRADGVLIDLWRLWSIKSGIPVSFTGAYNKEAQAMVADGRADINAGLFENKERSAFLDFSDPIINSHYHIFYRPSFDDSGNALIDSIDDFEKYSLGVTRGSFHENYLREHYPELKLLVFEGYQAMFTAAQNGDIQGVVTQSPYLNYYLSTHTNGPNTAGKETNQPFLRLTPELYSRNYKASVKKGNETVLKAINQSLSLLTAEDRRVVLQYWLGKSPDKIAFQKLLSVDNLNLTDEELNWLKEHPMIEIGIDGHWPPIDFIDENGSHTGIAHEFIEKMAKQLGVQFKPIASPTFKKMLAKVRKGELKLASTIVDINTRSNDLWFTKPFFTAQKVIVSRKNSRQYRSAEELFGKVVAIENGFSTMKQLQKLYPRIQFKPVESTLKALKEVSWGNVDAYIGNGAVAQWIMQAHQITNIEFSGDPSFEPAPQRFAVHKDPQWKPLVGIINKALRTIDLKQRNEIYQNWLSTSDLSQTISRRLKLTTAEQDWLGRHHDIRLGVDNSWAPIEFVDDQGIYKGLSSEFVKVISRTLQLSMTPIKDLTWEQVIEKAKIKELDMIPALMESESRSEYLNFTESYLNFPFVVFVKNDLALITELTDLYGKNVAVEMSYVTKEYLQKDFPKINLIEVSNTQEGLEKVSLGQVDAYIGNLTVGSYLITKYGISNVKVGGTTPYRYDLKMGVRKDWPELVTILNKFLATLSAEEKSNIRQKWLSVKYDVNVDKSIVKKIVIAASILLIFSLFWIIYIKRKQIQLSRSEEQLNKIINTIPLAIVLSDKTGVIVKANPHVSKELQVEEGTVVGRNMGEFYADGIEREWVLNNLKEKGIAKDIQVHFRTDTGKVVTGLLSAIPIRVGNQIVNLGMFVNLTERIKMEEALKRAKEESEQSSQFKSDFLANMSHEIRTPMNAIIGMSHLALQTELNDKQFDYINKVKVSAHNLLGIINDILDFSKIEAGKLTIEKTEFYLDEVLENLANMVNIKAEEKELKIIFRQDELIQNSLVGDPLRLGQVLVNLVQNAIKFTETGQVIISAEMVSINDNKIEICFSVKDSGIGIATEQVEHLFDPFIQADTSISRKHGGTGLGLSISRQIVELMGSNLEVTSELGQGSCFSFKVNFEKQNNAQQRLYEQRKPIPLFSRRLKGTVLLVEDNSINQQVAREILEGFGLLVIIAEDGYDAVKKIHQTDFDLVLMDIQMPDMDGLEATQLIRSEEKYFELPIVAMTAHAMEGDKEICLNKGMNDYLSKPIEPEKLLQTLVKWLGEGDVGENFINEDIVNATVKDSADQNFAQEAALALPESLPGIDVDWGLNRVGGNKILFFKLLVDFNRNHSGCCQQLEQLLLSNIIDAKSHDEALRLVHTIYGVAGNLGARDLQESAQVIENTLREKKDNKQWPLLIKNFCEQAQIIFEGLETLMVLENELIGDDLYDISSQKNIGELRHSSDREHDELPVMIEKLNTLLSEGDSKAFSAMVNFKNMISSSEQKFDKLLFIQLEQQINDYEYDEAIETLQKIALFFK